MKSDFLKKISKYEEGKGTFFKGIKLSSNESPFIHSTNALKYILDSLKNSNRYPPKNPYNLKKLISQKFKLSGKNIILGNGSDEIMQMIFTAFISQSNNIIIPEKTFLMYKILADIFGIEVKFSKLKNNLEIDLADISSLIDRKTKAIFIATPNNPTGQHIKYEEICPFLKNLPKNVLCVLDMAYIDFADENYENKTKNILKMGKKNIIILRTFSKSFGMAGLRLGYGISDTETINYLETVRQPFNVNIAAISLAEYYLKNHNIIEKRINTIKKNKKNILRKMKKLNVEFLPSEANFIAFKIKNPYKFFLYCAKNNVYIRYLKSFGMKDYLRVTVSTQKENKKFLDLLENYLKERRWQNDYRIKT